MVVLNITRFEVAMAQLCERYFTLSYRTKKGIELAKATYEGLDRAHPKEYYRWFPGWIKDRGRERKF